MTLLTVGARLRKAPIPDAVQPDPDTTPYSMPTTAPWNAPNYAITPTPDGSGSVVHPSVVDMRAQWNGYRYWMAVTPYASGNDQLENPCVLASHDGYTWVVPSGLTNPLDPPPANGYNSDTEIVWDASEARMVVYWRSVVNDNTETVWASTSTDGVTWSAPAEQAEQVGSDAAFMSPTVVKLGTSAWAMFSVGYANGGRIFKRTAASPLGPWGSPVQVTHTPSTIGQLWHLGVQKVDGILYAIINERSTDWELWPAISTDGGTNWTVGTAFMANTAGWDSTTLYRAQFQPHENGTHFRVWYSSNGPSTWRAGYTQVPRSLWPAP